MFGTFGRMPIIARRFRALSFQVALTRKLVRFLQTGLVSFGTFPSEAPLPSVLEERKRCENSWVLVLNSQGKNGPMNQCENYTEAKRIKERLYEESGERNTNIHHSKQVRQRANQLSSRSREGAERIDPTTGRKWYHSAASSSSSSSWWQSTDQWWQAWSWNEQ